MLNAASYSMAGGFTKSLNVKVGHILCVLSPSAPFFDSTLLHASGVWNLVRDYGLEKGQVPMYDNSQSI